MFTLGANVQNWVSFDSLEHVKYDASWREMIAQLHRTRWAKKKRFNDKKRKLKIVWKLDLIEKNGWHFRIQHLVKIVRNQFRKSRRFFWLLTSVIYSVFAFATIPFCYRFEGRRRQRPRTRRPRGVLSSSPFTDGTPTNLATSPTCRYQPTISSCWWSSGNTKLLIFCSYWSCDNISMLRYYVCPRSIW